MSRLFEFKIINNGAGGDCLYRSIAVFSRGSENDHYEVRQLVCQDIGKNWRKYMANIITQHYEEVKYFRNIKDRMEELTNEEIAECRRLYMEYMGRKGTYGTITELIAASRVLKFNFSVIQQLREPTNTARVQIYRIDEKYPWACFLFTGDFRKGHWRVCTPFPDKNIYMSSGLYMVEKNRPNVDYTLNYIKGTIAPTSVEDEQIQSPKKRKIDNDVEEDRKQRVIRIVPTEILWTSLGFKSEQHIENGPYEDTKTEGMSIAKLKTGEIVLKLNPGMQAPLVKARSNMSFQILKGDIIFAIKLANKNDISYRIELRIKEGEYYRIENQSKDQVAYIYCTIEHPADDTD